MTTIGVEALVKWALLMEAPKDGLPSTAVASAWAGFETLASLGTLVDTGGFGGDGGWGGGEEAHPDAVTIAAAVQALDDDFVLVGSDDFDPMAGWPDFGAVGALALARAWGLVAYEETDAKGAPTGVLRLRSTLAAQVRRVAILGRWPEWRGETPVCTVVKRQGKPVWSRKIRRETRWNEAGEAVGWDWVEVDGYDARRKRPFPDAYRSFALEPDPAGLLASRIEYALSHAALTALAERLDGLGGRHVLPPLVPEMPWAAATESAAAE